jgi:hypothetical protein
MARRHSRTRGSHDGGSIQLLRGMKAGCTGRERRQGAIARVIDGAWRAVAIRPGGRSTAGRRLTPLCRRILTAGGGWRLRRPCDPAAARPGSGSRTARSPVTVPWAPLRSWQGCEKRPAAQLRRARQRPPAAVAVALPSPATPNRQWPRGRVSYGHQRETSRISPASASISSGPASARKTGASAVIASRRSPRVRAWALTISSTRSKRRGACSGERARSAAPTEPMARTRRDDLDRARLAFV